MTTRFLCKCQIKSVRGQLKDINYSKLIAKLFKNRNLVSAFYYIAPLDIKTNPKKYWQHQKFISMLQNIPRLKVVLCTLKKYRQKDGTYGFQIKGDDARLVHDFLVYAFEDKYDTAIIVSGDEDFAHMIDSPG